MKRLQIITSPACNNNCIFCIDNKLRGRISAETLDRNAIGALKRMAGKVERVLFTAGEPTLNPKLLEFIKLARKLGYREIGLITNGRRLADRGFCRQLLQAGVNEINVSFHGSRANIQDKLTQAKGSFRQTLQGLKNLKELKEKCDFRFLINFTVTEFNLEDIGQFLKLTRRLKPDALVFNVVIPKGRALDNFELVVPFYSQVARDFKKALGKNESISISILGLPFCLMRGGLERFGGGFEKIIIKNPGKKSRLKRVSPWGETIKGTDCKKCNCRQICQGVWRSYIKKRGWQEFKPIYGQKK